MQSLHTLQTAVAGWKQQYLLVAPFAGRVRFSSATQENQTLRSGAAAFFIAPEQKQYVGDLRLSQTAIFPMYCRACLFSR
jgi:hypothetical protein